MYDTLYYSKPFRTLNIIDECNREVLTIEIDTCLLDESSERLSSWARSMGCHKPYA